MLRRHRLWNSLVEIERDYRSRISAVLRDEIYRAASFGGARPAGRAALRNQSATARGAKTRRRYCRPAGRNRPRENRYRRCHRSRPGEPARTHRPPETHARLARDRAARGGETGPGGLRFVLVQLRRHDRQLRNRPQARAARRPRAALSRLGRHRQGHRTLSARAAGSRSAGSRPAAAVRPGGPACLDQSAAQ